MNKEVLFRGKMKKTGKWVYGNLITRNCDGYNRAYIYDNSVDETEIEELHLGDGTYYELKDLFFEIDINTIGQYIGLKDKNGRKIFEGDILIIPSERLSSSHGSWYKKINKNHGFFDLRYVVKNMQGDLQYSKVEYEKLRNPMGREKEMQIVRSVNNLFDGWGLDHMKVVSNSYDEVFY